MFDNFFFRKSYLFLDNAEKYGKARQATAHALYMLVK